MMVFSKNVPEPACSINQQQQQKYVESKNQFIQNCQDRYIMLHKKKPHVGTKTTTFSSFKNINQMPQKVYSYMYSG
jgi:hypothetical protein